MVAQRSSASGLRDDTRGAVMIVGIVIGAILVGALWHIASVGDAILWRERAQDAADAAVFENAVWHARGMNMCAAVNIVMAAVLSILVIWRTILILVSVALVISTILCIVTFGTGCGFAGAVLRVETFMLRNDNKVANGVARVIGAMNAAEVAVATATPLIALGTSKVNTESAYKVKSAWTQSMSLLPSINDKGFQTLQRCAKGWKAGKITKTKPKPKSVGAAYAWYNDYINQSRMGFVVSLPMQLETYGLLCDKAGQFVLNSLAGILESMGVPSGTVEGIDKAKAALGGIVSMLPGLFCAPMGTPPGVQQMLDDQSKEACKSDKDKDRVFIAGGPDGTEVKYKDSDGTLVDEDTYVKNCADKKKKEAKDKLDDAFKQTSDQYGFAECGQPSKVWEWATNGNVFMRSFSEVKKDTPMLAHDDKGLKVGAFQGATLEQVDTDDVLAHAEMFYDCTGPWASSSCRSNAMWALRWRARLRRVQSAGKLVSSAIEPIVVSTLTQAINELANEKVNDFVKDKFKVPPILFPKLKETWIARYIKTNYVMGGLYKSGGFEKVGNLIERSSADSGVIH